MDRCFQIGWGPLWRESIAKLHAFERSVNDGRKARRDDRFVIVCRGKHEGETTMSPSAERQRGTDESR